MYIPKNLVMTDMAAIESLISDYGFGLLISQDLETTRLPLLYDAKVGEKGVIVGHMARANPQWRNLSGQRVSIVFSGPHAYVSPTWYVSRPGVSTWNYASVQCFGTFQELNREDTVHAIDSLIQKYEPEITNNTSLMPADYMEKLLKAVVGFKVVVDDIHAKEKLGQQKKNEDQLGVYNALRQSPDSEARQLADYMKKRGLGNGSG